MPACSAGVPVGTSEAASGAEWTGTCTFTLPGTYLFYCTVHGAAMSGTITVGSTASGPPISTPPPTTPVGPTLPGGEGSGSGQPGSSPGAAPGQSDSSPFAGGASALKLSSRQRGSTVRGAVDVSAAGVRGRLQVELLARVASPAREGHAKEVHLGSLEREGLTAGTVHFAVPLSARGKSALKRKGRLALTVELALTPPGGGTAKLGRSVLLRPAVH
jgi:hypothetical protein